MNILIIGSGGREHALAWKIKQSPICEALFIASGNAGTAMIGTNVAIADLDFDKLAEFSIKENIGLIVVGNEAPLVAGIKDYFVARPDLKDILMIAPSQKGAMLEGSKDFSKIFMEKYGIPAAKSRTFDKESLEEGLEYLSTIQKPIVLKADGLAAGKGVIITNDVEEAKNELRQMIAEQKFGNAGDKVLVEEFLEGIEVSVFVLTDGKNYKILPEAKDYKQIGEGNTGLNTGGMGAVSPVPFADAEFIKSVEQTMIKPTLKGLREEDIDFCGFIFLGIMCVKGEPYLLEYNVRMGDPETEVVLPRISSDFLDLLIKCAERDIDTATLEIIPQSATGIVCVSGGYPETYQKGKIIQNLDKVDENVLVFHAGTKEKNGEILTNGGRVLVCTAFGDTLEEALEISKQAAQNIEFDKKYFRSDIGFDLL